METQETQPTHVTISVETFNKIAAVLSQHPWSEINPLMTEIQKDVKPHMDTTNGNDSVPNDDGSGDANHTDSSGGDMGQ